jgi:hypothetical protein
MATGPSVGSVGPYSRVRSPERQRRDRRDHELAALKKKMGSTPPKKK